jgi:hypothetical protein
VFPDGSLHAGPAQRGAATSLPLRRRVLSTDDMAALWALVQAHGVSDADNSSNLRAPAAGPAPGELRYRIEFTANDRRWAMLRSSGPGEVPDPDAVAIIRHIAALAWETDAPPQRVMVAPRRYDLGPDPYAKYRQP